MLVPRPETELLVDWACEAVARAGRAAVAAVDAAPIRVVDLGTGSGAIALALKHAHPQSDGDRHRRQRRRARRRAAQRRPARPGDRARRDVVVAAAWKAAASTSSSPTRPTSPPTTRTWPRLRHEPALALTPGGDGLDALRAIVAGAAAHLRPGRLAAPRARLRPGRRRARAARRRRLRRGRDPARPGRSRAGDRRSAAARPNRRSQAIPSVAKALCAP